jgi:hypothetical protein
MFILPVSLGDCISEWSSSFYEIALCNVIGDSHLQGDISGFHGGEYEGSLCSGLLCGVVWRKSANALGSYFQARSVINLVY